MSDTTNNDLTVVMSDNVTELSDGTIGWLHDGESCDLGSEAFRDAVLFFRSNRDKTEIVNEPEYREFRVGDFRAAGFTLDDEIDDNECLLLVLPEIGDDE